MRTFNSKVWLLSSNRGVCRIDIESLIEELKEAEKARKDRIPISPIIDIYETNKDYWHMLSKIRDYLWFDDKVYK